MYRGHRVAVVMPAYNVQDHIHDALRTLPEFVDIAIVVDDASTDHTYAAAQRAALRPLSILQHSQNRGVGAAIASGYRHALLQHAELIAVMAGDGQMDPADLSTLLDPLVEGSADYTKGNRFNHPQLWRAMPALRIIGNIALSLLTKFSSGYLHIFDSQCGYTAISRAALERLGCRFFPRYGYPNDVLARLRSSGARVADVTVRPIYDGQRSGIRPWTIVYPMLYVLIRSALRRLNCAIGSWAKARIAGPVTTGLAAKPLTTPPSLAESPHLGPVTK